MRSPGRALRCALALALACGTAVADERGLSRAETERRAPRLAPHFDAIDADRDGRITAYEIRAWRKAGRVRGAADRRRAGFDQFFRRADTDGDGALSRGEAARALPRIARKFDRIDADRDGRLSLEETHAWLDATRAPRSGVRAAATAGGSAK
jgi:Ca2+-binding EF-hand superfamily protein